jgi:hypothetical protein
MKTKTRKKVTPKEQRHTTKATSIPSVICAVEPGETKPGTPETQILALRPETVQALPS